LNKRFGEKINPFPKKIQILQWPIFSKIPLNSSFENLRKKETNQLAGQSDKNIQAT